MIEYSVIPKETILVFLIICTLILLLIQFARRKWNFKKYIGVISLSAIFGIYLYNIFGDIALGGASEFDDFYYSKIPFGNLIYNHAGFDENIIAQYRHDFTIFFAITITFLILFGFIVVYFFEITHLKLFWLFSFIGLELIQILLMELSYRFLISKTYPLVFDTGAFILVPICLALGIVMGKTLKGTAHDKSKQLD